MTKSLENFARQGYITKSDANEILDEALESSLGYFYKVSDIIALTNRQSEIKDPAVWEEMVEFAKQGELIKNAEKFGMQVGKNPGSRHKLIQYHKKTNHEFDTPTQWDNTEVVKIMEQLWNEREVIDVGKFEDEIRAKTISQKILNLITRIQNRKLKRLEAPQEDYREPENCLEQYQVSSDRLKPVRNSKKSRNPLRNKEKDEKM